MDLEINCQQVAELLQTDSPLLLIDCREPSEHAIAAIEGAKLIPMATIPSQLDEIKNGLASGSDTPLVVHCHHGMRSAQVATWLRENGFPKAQSMAGGIDVWACEIDNRIDRY